MKPMLLVAAICTLFLSASLVNAQEDHSYQCYLQGITPKTPCILIAGAHVRIEYPLDLAQNPLIASTIDPFIQRTKDDFLSFLPPRFGNVFSLDMTYDVFHHSDYLLSLVFTVSEYTGARFGLASFQGYTFDLIANKLLTLNDLFLPNSDPFSVIAPLAEANLVKELNPDITDRGLIDAGTGKNPDNYKDFSLDQDTLTFYFEPGQIAGDAYGPISVSIPLSDLSSVLNPGIDS